MARKPRAVCIEDWLQGYTSFTGMECPAKAENCTRGRLCIVQWWGLTKYDGKIGDVSESLRHINQLAKVYCFLAHHAGMPP